MANLPTLCNRRLQDVAILMYKVKYHLCPKYISNLFSLNSSGYALRNVDFIVPRFNTMNFRKHRIRYLGPVLWSKLSMDVRRSDTLQVFKNRIRRIDLNNLINEHCTCMLCDSWHLYSDMFYYSLNYCSFNQYILRQFLLYILWIFILYTLCPQSANCYLGAIVDPQLTH